MNQVITEVPFGTGTINAHVDTSSGSLEMDIGHLDKADVTVTLDYATAKAVFVDGTVSAAMAAFMAGKVRVQGEMAKLLSALQQLSPPDESSVDDRPAAHPRDHRLKLRRVLRSSSTRSPDPAGPGRTRRR